MGSWIQCGCFLKCSSVCVEPWAVGERAQISGGQLTRLSRYSMVVVLPSHAAVSRVQSAGLYKDTSGCTNNQKLSGQSDSVQSLEVFEDVLTGHPSPLINCNRFTSGEKSSTNRKIILLTRKHTNPQSLNGGEKLSKKKKA